MPYDSMHPNRPYWSPEGQAESFELRGIPSPLVEQIKVEWITVETEIPGLFLAGKKVHLIAY